MSEGAVWVTNPDVGTVTRIDPDEQEVRDSIPVGENPTGIAVGFDAVWVVESGGPSVSRISPATNSVVGDPIAVGNGPAEVAVGEGSVWVTNRFDGTISRIDPDPGGAVERIPVGLDPRGIAVGFGSAWVTLSGSNTVVRLDPQTNRQTGVVNVGNAPGSLAAGAGAVWVVNSLDDTVMQISPDTNSVVGTVQVGDSPSGIAVVDGIVWVANEADGSLSRIDPGETPGQPSARTIVVGSVPQGIAGVNGDLWVSVRGAAISHRGGTLRMVSLESPGSLDPGLGPGNAWLVWHLMGDGLVAFEPTGGIDSAVVPDLATSIPTPTDGGRTYTFELRAGIRYSSGEVVIGDDFRRALERGFLAEGFADYFGGLVGGAACESEPGTCDLSEGVETDDESRTITFHLIEADPDFLFKLTLPSAYPVPSSVPSEEQKTTGIPGTGPYMLDAPMTADGLALVRNPHFQVWSPAAQPDGFVDRIEWSFGVEYEAQVEAVASGEADYAVDASSSEGLEEILVRYPAQVHVSSTAGVHFIVLNTEVPPFDDVDVRRAMNFAVDRDRVAEIFGGGVLSPLASCQTIPPNFPGYEPYCPYTLDPGPGGDGSWTAPDMEEAQRLVDRSGTNGMRVVLEYDPVEGAFLGPGLGDYGDYIIELLEDLGYRGSVRPVPADELERPGREFQMVPTGWGMLYPAASDFIASLHKCGATFHPIRSGFCDRRIDAMIDRAVEMQVEDPAATGALWAEIDRAVVDQAPYLWLVNPTVLVFVSERVGNYQQSPVSGVLLNQLWVQ